VRLRAHGLLSSPRLRSLRARVLQTTRIVGVLDVGLPAPIYSVASDMFSLGACLLCPLLTYAIRAHTQTRVPTRSHVPAQ
jgi:hypothetical protein